MATRQIPRKLPAADAAAVVTDDSVAVMEPEQEAAMTLSQPDLNRLSSILGKNILTREDLISQVTFLSCISVEGVSINLEPGLISRIKSRCYKEEFSVFLRKMVIKQLHDCVGW